jgi:hypothetical protein
MSVPIATVPKAHAASRTTATIIASGIEMIRAIRTARIAGANRMVKKPSARLRFALFWTVERTNITCSGRSVLTNIPRIIHANVNQK